MSGSPSPESTGFTSEEVERSRRYHRPLYVALGINFVLGLGTLAAAAAFLDLQVGPWWLSAPVLATVSVVLVTLVRLPVTIWRGWFHERRFGFSTQFPAGFAGDILRKLLLASLFGSLPVLGVVGLARALPSWWPAAAAAGAAVWVLAVGFLAPIVLEPIFNRFTPLEDRALAESLRTLATRAGVPVRDVLVSDASRRTRKVNAYVSGIGATRRVVLFDTLLRAAPVPELEVVVAHELGHRRARHVAKGTLLAMVGAAVGVLALWALLDDPADPAVAPRILLIASVLELAGLPFETALSRRWERQADRFSLELTGDREAFRSVHRRLATTNLSDLDPPRFVYRLLFTHPTPPERLAATA